MIAMINAHMLGTPTEPGEHVDWSEPDIMTEADWTELLGTSVAEYAASSPHMIVWEVEPSWPGPHDSDSERVERDRARSK